LNYLLQLKLANEKLEGDGKEAMRRRNALVNSLSALAPDARTGQVTVKTLVRKLLYALAPPELWQLVSCQGAAGTQRISLVENMDTIYKVILAAAANKCSAPSQIIVTEVSAVMRSCQSRAPSLKFRQKHPDLFKDLPSKSKTNDTSKLKSKKKKTRALPPISDSDDDVDLATSSTSSLTRALPRPSRNLSARNNTPTMHSSEESVEIDDSDIDMDYDPHKQ
jgi:hypothetical protein